MAEVTNNSAKTPIGLPNSQVIAPGQTVTVTGWGKIKVNKVVAHYLSVGVLSAEDEEPDDDLADEAQDKQRILAQLKALGISAGANSKLDTLRTKLEEAEAALAKEREEVIATLNAKEVAFEPTESLEELKTKLAATV